MCEREGSLSLFLFNLILLSKMKKEYKKVSRDITLASGTPAGTHAISITLPTEQDICEGACVSEDSDGGIAGYRIGLKDETREFTTPFHKSKWITTGAKAADMFHELGFEITANTISVLVVTKAALTSELSFEMLFNCSRVVNK